MAFSDGIRNFFKSMKPENEEVSYTEHSKSQVKEPETFSLKDKTNSDVFILLNTNQCHLNFGESSFYSSSQIKPDPEDDIIVSDSEVLSVKKELSLQVNKTLISREEIPQCVSSSFMSTAQSKYVTSTRVIDKDVTITDTSEHNTDYRSVDEDSESTLPIQSVYVTEEHFLEESDEEIQMEKEDCSEDEVPFCNKCGKILSEGTSKNVSFCKCPTILVSQSKTPDYLSCSSSANVQDSSKTVSALHGKNETAIFRLLCNICSDSFAGPYGLVKHVQVAHSIKISIRDALQYEKVKSSKSFRSANSGSKKIANHFESEQLDPLDENYPISSESNSNLLTEKSALPVNDSVTDFENQSVRSSDSTKNLDLNSTTCPHCGKVLRNKAILLAHCEYHCAETETFLLVCKICSSQISGPMALMKHFKQQHNKKLSFEQAKKAEKVKNDKLPKVVRGRKENRTCTFCKKIFQGFLAFKIHCDFSCPHRDQYKLLCPICSNAYAGPRILRRHLIRVHKKEKNRSLILSAEKVKCDEICDSEKPETSKKIDLLEKACEFCGKVIRGETALLKHLEYHCPKTETFRLVCKVCSKRIAGDINLVSHLKQRHNTSISLEEAKKAEKVKNDNKSLKVVCSKENRTCKPCQKVFPCFSAFNMHCDYHCPASREKFKLLCPVCFTAYAGPVCLRSHLILVHKKKRTIGPLIRSAKKVRCNENTENRDTDSDQLCASPKRSFHCPFCKKEFSRLERQQSHVDFHCPNKKGKFKLVCKVCSKSYSGPSGLKYHMLTVHKICITLSKALSAKRIKVTNKSSKNQFNMSSKLLRNRAGSSRKPDTSVSDEEYNPRISRVTSSQDKTISKRTGDYNRTSNSPISETDKELNNKKAEIDLSKKLRSRKGRCQTFNTSSVQNLRATKLLKVFEQTGLSSSSNCSCPICGKYVRSSSLLKIHMRKHTNEKPFRCRLCEKGFFSKISMKYHVIAKCPKRMQLSETALKSSNQSTCHEDMPVQTSNNLTDRKRSCTNKSVFYKDHSSSDEESDIEMVSDSSNDEEISSQVQEKDNSATRSFSESIIFPSELEENRLLEEIVLQSEGKSNSSSRNGKSFSKSINFAANGFEENRHSVENSFCEDEIDNTKATETDTCNLKNQKFECRHCSKLYTARKAVIMHERYCKSNEFRQIDNPTQLQQIKNGGSKRCKKSNPENISSEENNLVLMCGICPHESQCPSKITVHSISNHNKIDVICKKCNGRFHDYDKLIAHLKVNDEQFYYCDKTKKPADNRRDELRTSDTNLKTDKENENIFSCNVCSTKFSSIPLLVSHLQFHMM